MTRISVLVLLTSLAGAAAAGPPPCVGETTLSGRAACLDARADALLLRMETAFARLGARHAAGDASLAEGIERAQTRWRAEMEADCASLSAPDRARARIARARCRLAEAERRRWRLSGVIADLPDPLDRLRPEVEIILPVRPPGGPIRPRPREGRTPG